MQKSSKQHFKESYFLLAKDKKTQRLALKPFNAFPFNRCDKYKDWKEHQFCLACTGIDVVPRLSFFTVVRLTATDLGVHNILSINSFALSSFWMQNKTHKLKNSYKKCFCKTGCTCLQCTHSILTIGKQFMYSMVTYHGKT